MPAQLISILLPVKNAAIYLESCLKSILEQTYMDWELLAINDHSTDESFELLTGYAEKDMRIKVFQNPGEGIIPALRKAYAEASGNLITRMDADDIMVPSKLEKMKSLLLNKGKGHIATGLVSYFSDGELGDGYKKYQDWLNELSLVENNYSEIYKECVIPSPCWMVHREDLDSCSAFCPDTYPEDYDLCFRFYKNDLKVVSVKEILHHWRDYPERTSRNDSNYSNVHFFDLKINYFIDLEYNPERPLVLWGAGRKGKQLAKALQAKGIDFHWFTDNPQKIGHYIYDVQLQHSDHLKALHNPLIIIAVAAPDALIQIYHKLDKFHFEKGENYFQFC